MKLRRTIIAFLSVLAATILCCGVLTACGGDGDDHEGVHIVFELEGGTYKNSTRAISYYYPVAEGKTTSILTPEKFAGNREVERAGYHIEGWYETKEVAEDGTVTYKDKWDFEKNKIDSTMDTITLYARWLKNAKYTFVISYFEEGEEHQVASYPVNEGDTFSDRQNRADTRTGYTAVRVQDEASKWVVGYYSDKECTTPWDPATTHPGGEGDVPVPVYVKYMAGDYTYVSTAAELTVAVASSRGIYLTQDIDFGGKEFGGFRDGAGTYKRAVQGNGHSVKNFVLNYPKQKEALLSQDPDNLLSGTNLLCIGLFGILDGAKIENITFEDFSVEIGSAVSVTGGIYFAPVAVKAMNATLSSVTVRMTVTEGKTNYGGQNKHYQFADPFCVKDEATTVEDCDIQVDHTAIAE